MALRCSWRTEDSDWTLFTLCFILFYFFQFGVCTCYSLLENRWSKWAIMKMACKPHAASLVLVACNGWRCSAGPKHSCCLTTARYRLCPVGLCMVSFCSQGKSPPSLVQVLVWLCGALFTLDVFWFGEDLHLLPSITLVTKNSLQPSCSSFPKENKECSGLKQERTGGEFSNCVYVFPPFLRDSGGEI